MEISNEIEPGLNLNIFSHFEKIRHLLSAISCQNLYSRSYLLKTTISVCFFLFKTCGVDYLNQIHFLIITLPTNTTQTLILPLK